MLSGVKNGAECWCGEILGRVEWTPHQGDCTTPCPGHPYRLCGGEQAMNVMPTGIGQSFWNRC